MKFMYIINGVRRSSEKPKPLKWSKLFGLSWVYAYHFHFYSTVINVTLSEDSCLFSVSLSEQARGMSGVNENQFTLVLLKSLSFFLPFFEKCFRVTLRLFICWCKSSPLLQTAPPTGWVTLLDFCRVCRTLWCVHMISFPLHGVGLCQQ